MSTTQLSLFDKPKAAAKPFDENFERTFSEPLAKGSDALSSHRTGDRMLRSGRLRGQMRAILAALRAHPGLTSTEIAVAYPEYFNIEGHHGQQND